MASSQALLGRCVAIADHQASGHVPDLVGELVALVRSAGGRSCVIGPAALVARFEGVADGVVAVDDPWSSRGLRREVARHRFVRQVLAASAAAGADLVHWSNLDNFVVPTAVARVSTATVATLHRTYFVPPATRGRWAAYRRTIVRAAFERVRARGPVVVHDARSVAALGARGVVSVPFPVDVSAWPTGEARVAARRARRAAWGVDPDASVLLVFGATRREKGLPLAVAALAEVDPRTVLVVAGAPRTYGAAHLRDWVAADPRLQGRVIGALGHVPEAEVGDLFAASDAVVLPYAEGFAGSTGPGTLAAAYGVAIAASRLPEWEAAFGAEGLARFATPGDPRALADAVRTALEAPPAEAMTAAFRAAHEPRAFAAAMVATYGDALDRRAHLARRPK